MTRVVAAAGLALALLVAVPGTASAHNAGRVELLVTNLHFTRSPGAAQGIVVNGDLIDRDSGASAAGFAIVVSVTGPGAPAGPVTLIERLGNDRRGTGHYEGLLPVGPGSWTVTATAEQGTSALPALGSTRTAEVKVDANGEVSRAQVHGGGSNVGLWLALAAAAAVLAAGVVMVMGRKAAPNPATRPAGQRI
jgi:hypothetical protein